MKPYLETFDNSLYVLRELTFLPRSSYKLYLVKTVLMVWGLTSLYRVT